MTAIFDDDAGWTAIAGVLGPEQVTRVLDACIGLTESASPGDLGPGDKVAGGTQHLNGLPERVPEVAGILQHPELLAVVEQLLGGPGVAGDIAFRNPRPGYGGQRLHADAVPQPSRDSPTTTVTAVIALVDITERNGPTRVVPGSHRRPDLQRVAGSLERHPDEVRLTGPAGTAFVFSGHLLHSGTTNESDAPRPVLQVVWRSGGRPI